MSTGMPAGIWLQKFGTIVRDYFGHVAYHVGSSLDRKDWRDVDVRLLLDDDEFTALFGDVKNYANPKLAAITLAFSALGKQMTGLPIDFQIQPLSWANKHYSGQKRSALIEVHTPPAAAVPGDGEQAAGAADAPHIFPGVTHKMFDVQHPAHAGQTCAEYESAHDGCTCPDEVEYSRDCPFHKAPADAEPVPSDGAGAGDGEQDATTMTRSGPCATSNCAFCTCDDCGCACHDVTHTAPGVAAPDADSGEQTTTTQRGPMPVAGWPCSKCGTSGIDCLDLVNSGTPSRCCGWCPLIDGHGDTTTADSGETTDGPTVARGGQQWPTLPKPPSVPGGCPRCGALDGPHLFRDCAGEP